MNDESLDIEIKECVDCGEDIGWSEDNHEKPIEPVCYTCLEKRYYSEKTKRHDVEATIESQDSKIEKLTGKKDHPEHYCHRCGGRNMYSWSLDNDTWNEIVESHPDIAEWRGIICPSCLCELDRDKYGDYSIWYISKTDPRELKATIEAQAKVIECSGHQPDCVSQKLMREQRDGIIEYLVTWLDNQISRLQDKAEKELYQGLLDVIQAEIAKLKEKPMKTEPNNYAHDGAGPNFCAPKESMEPGTLKNINDNQKKEN